MISDAPDMDEGAPSRGTHRRQQRAGHRKGGAQVDVQLGVEIFLCGFVQELQDERARIAHDDVGNTHVGEDACRRGLPRAGVGQVAGVVGEAVVRARLERTGHPHHPGTGIRERGRRRRTDAAGRAGDDRNLAGETGHS